MDYSRMIAFHEERNAKATVAAIEMPIEQASAFGMIVADDDLRVEKAPTK